MIEKKPDRIRNFLARVQQMAKRMSTSFSCPFPLVHPDFGSYNILVDDQYNIQSIIDWDRVATLPIEFTGIFPADLVAFPDAFWVGSPFDNDKRRQEVSRDQILWR